MTQPTRGLGVVVNMPARGELQRARHVLAVAASSNAIIARVPRQARRTVAPRALQARLDFLQRVAEVGDVLEAAIDRGEADVGDLVELVELLHHHLADLPRWDLALAERQHLLHDALDRLVDVFGRHRTLVQRALEAVADACDVEVRRACRCSSRPAAGAAPPSRRW